MKKRAVYAGSFDPITNGHLWMIEQGSQLFDELFVAVGINPEKRYTFSVAERVQMLHQSTTHLPHIIVDSFESQFLVNYAVSINASYIIRGIRNGTDYEFERGWRYLNSDLRADITTLFLIPPRELAEISSSMVKGIVGPIGWEEIVKQYVPDVTYQLLVAKFKEHD